jgi:hypothetical protein
MPPSLEKFHADVECFEWWEHRVWPWPSMEEERSTLYPIVDTPHLVTDNVTMAGRRWRGDCNLSIL